MVENYVVLGATGHVGSTVVKALLERERGVIAITRDAERASHLKKLGAQIAVVDVHDSDTLRQTFRRGERLFLLNPPAPPSSDTVEEERKNLDSIFDALPGSGLKRIVAESTYGAQSGDGNGDLGVLFDMEQRLASGKIPFAIIRAAYYMSNWDLSLKSAKSEGKVHTLYSTDFKLPMVAPADLGRFAARLLTDEPTPCGIFHVEGPDRYSASDVATAALGRPVEAFATPSQNWISTLKEQGFSEPAAASMVRMTNITLESDFDITGTLIRGETTLTAYITKLIASDA